MEDRALFQEAQAEPLCKVLHRDQRERRDESELDGCHRYVGCGVPVSTFEVPVALLTVLQVPSAQPDDLQRTDGVDRSPGPGLCVEK